jgi:hypothetical protein
VTIGDGDVVVLDAESSRYGAARMAGTRPAILKN